MQGFVLYGDHVLFFFLILTTIESLFGVLSRVVSCQTHVFKMSI